MSSFEPAGFTGNYTHAGAHPYSKLSCEMQSLLITCQSTGKPWRPGKLDVVIFKGFICQSFGPSFPNSVLLLHCNLKLVTSLLALAITVLSELLGLAIKPTAWMLWWRKTDVYASLSFFTLQKQNTVNANKCSETWSREEWFTWTEFLNTCIS